MKQEPAKMKIARNHTRSLVVAIFPAAGTVLPSATASALEAGD
jgi:hypothetical protein